ncbi:alpha-hydroxy-acid oxidizing protein [Desulfohalovibrio reitneri]|uniref:alpha-hydroxy-acid oxidizing protein n=1 Tax=Desulfohalovibrio reitneri TaxID=1307759 RepID=UPI0004A6C377|nr:alpha-hydroxy-acid oxidizing protein [Desulfohalovibrio reitneri]
MDKATRDAARERLKGFCRVCKVCHGVACSGEVPGMGGAGTGSAFTANHQALAEVRLAMRTLHGVTEVETSASFFGKEFATPIQAAPMTGVSYNMGGGMGEEEFISAIVGGCGDAGSLGWTGDGADPAMFDSGLAAIREHGGGVAVIKPRSQDEIKARLHRAEEAGATAVGVDVDGAGLITMAKFGQPVGPKTPAELEELVRSTGLPFLAKGIMTVDEAEAARDAGCAGIVVSNHGGRVLDHTPGVAEVLPRIARRVGSDMTVFADGAVRSGADALKLLALGAHGVLVGRPLVTAVFGGGREAVAGELEAYRTQMVQAMLLTGAASAAAVPASVLAGDPLAGKG